MVESLIADLIIGMDVLASHQSVYLDLGGPKPPITFHLRGRDTEITPPISLERDQCTKACCSMFPIMTTEPPALFPDKLLTVKPISSKSRRVSADNSLFMKTEVKRLLDLGIIELSVSPWRAQAFVVKGSSKKRIVIDYSETVNLYTDVDAYPFPDVESMLTRAAAFHYFSKIDLKSAYHQIPLRSDDKPFTAFEVGGRLYQFTRLPFGVTNAVPAFQRIMDSFIERNQLRCAEPYLDDVYIGGITKEEHDRNLHAFLKAAEKESLTLNMDKCTFGTRKLSLLGHIIENGSKKPDPERLRVLMEYPVPHTAAQLKRLLGFFAYYSKWVSQYSLKVKPLLEAQKQGAFPLNRNCVDAIDSLKQGIASASLAIPIAGAGPLLLETDASGTALGATLSQGGRPLAFYSRTLSTSEQMQSSVEREAIAIVEAFRKWGHFVRTYETVVKTDQKSVSFIFSKHRSKTKNDKLTRWRLELSEFAYTIMYRKGSKNVGADALSRLSAISKESPCVRLHCQLQHPGVVRMWEFVRRHNLAFSLLEVKEAIQDCDTCKEVKPAFYKPGASSIIRALQPFERLAIDLVGPKSAARKTGNCYALTVIDEYSRFPFVFGIRTITSESIIACLRQLFSVFGCPAFVHPDRGSRFLSSEFDQFCSRNGISHSRTTQYNGTIFKTVKCILHSRNLGADMWESVLPEALATVRALLYTSTNESPHSRFFKFPRRAGLGCSLPEWLSSGNPAYLRNFVRGKEDPQVRPASISELINPHFARVVFPNGRIDTVSTKDLSRRKIPAQTDATEPRSPHLSPVKNLPNAMEHFPTITPEETSSIPVTTEQGAEEEDSSPVTTPKSTPVSPFAGPEVRRSLRPRRPPAHLKDYIQ